MDMLKINAQLGVCPLWTNTSKEVLEKLKDPPLKKRDISDEDDENERRSKMQCTNVNSGSNAPIISNDGSQDERMDTR